MGPLISRGTALLTILSCLLALAQASDGDASVLIKEIGRTSNQSLLWGPYRPNLYFGVRPRIPKSLTTGLMWAKADDYQTVQTSEYECLSAASYLADGQFSSGLRWTCEQHEGMAGYGWDEYDVRKGGRQTIHDAGNFIDIHTDFVKIPGGNHGGSWGVRIRGIPRENAPPNLKTIVVFTAGLEGLGSVEVANEPDSLGYDETVTLQGSTSQLGDFQLEITQGPETNSHPHSSHPSYEEKPLDRTMVSSAQVPEDGIWQAKGSRIWSYLDWTCTHLILDSCPLPANEVGD